MPSTLRIDRQTLHDVRLALIAWIVVAGACAGVVYVLVGGG